MNPAEILEMQRHKEIAEDSLRKLGDLNVKSCNKPWNRNSAARWAAIDGVRNAPKRVDGIGAGFTDALLGQNDRLGNCGERGCVFGYFACVHSKRQQSRVYLVHMVNWDHMFAVLTSANLGGQGTQHNLAAIGVTGAILDGWCEDWSFPNIARKDTVWHNAWRAANPFTLWVRNKTRTQGLIEVDEEIHRAA